MADFSHLMTTMDTIKNPAAPEKKASKKKAEPSGVVKSPARRSTSSSAGVNSITNPNPAGDGTKKKKKKKPEAGGAEGSKDKKGGDGTKKKKKKKSVSAGGADAPAVVRSAASRLGGPTIQSGLANAKTSKKVAKALATKSTGPDLSKKSKIWLALNPQALVAEDPKKKGDDEERNIIMMRGGGGLGVLDMDDAQMDRDEFGAIVEPSSDEEDFGFEEADDGNLADFDPETMKMLQAKRDERAKEENERRAKLKSVADKVKAEKDARFTASMKIINKAKAEERKRDELSDKDVKNAQQRMSSEIAFDFNFN